MLDEKTQELLRSYLERSSQEKADKAIVTVPNVIALAGVIVGGLGWKFGVENDRLASELQATLAQTQVELTIAGDKVTQSSIELSAVNSELNSTKNDVQELKRNKINLNRELETSKKTLTNLQGTITKNEGLLIAVTNQKIDALRIREDLVRKNKVLKQEQKDLVVLGKEIIDQKNALFEEVDALKTAKLELLTLLYPDENEFKPSLLKKLITPRFHSVKRAWHNIKNPRTFELYLQYPQKYEAQINNLIESVEYDLGDTRLSKIGNRLKYEKKDNSGRYWFADYVGHSPPNRIVAVIKLKSQKSPLKILFL